METTIRIYRESRSECGAGGANVRPVAVATAAGRHETIEITIDRNGVASVYEFSMAEFARILHAEAERLSEPCVICGAPVGDHDAGCPALEEYE